MKKIHYYPFLALILVVLVFSPRLAQAQGDMLFQCEITKKTTTSMNIKVGVTSRHTAAVRLVVGVGYTANKNVYNGGTIINENVSPGVKEFNITFTPNTKATDGVYGVSLVANKEALGTTESKPICDTDKALIQVPLKDTSNGNVNGANNVGNNGANNVGNNGANNVGNNGANNADGSGAITEQFVNPLKVDSLWGFVETVLGWVVRIGAIIVGLFFVISGFRFVAAQGNEEKLATAKRGFVYTLIGAALLLGAWTLGVIIDETIKQIAR